MPFDLHHISKRKRCADADLQPYPHPNKWVALLDKSMVIIAILGPVFNMPQVLKIYMEHTAAGLAISTWILLTLMKGPWILYARIHKDTPLLVTSILWALSNFAIVIGILIYG